MGAINVPRPAPLPLGEPARPCRQEHSDHVGVPLRRAQAAAALVGWVKMQQGWGCPSVIRVLSAPLPVSRPVSGVLAEASQGPRPHWKQPCPPAAPSFPVRTPGARQCCHRSLGPAGARMGSLLNAGEHPNCRCPTCLFVAWAAWHPFQCTHAHAAAKSKSAAKHECSQARACYKGVPIRPPPLRAGPGPSRRSHWQRPG